MRAGAGVRIQQAHDFNFCMMPASFFFFSYMFTQSDRSHSLHHHITNTPLSHKTNIVSVLTGREENEQNAIVTKLLHCDRLQE